MEIIKKLKHFLWFQVLYFIAAAGLLGLTQYETFAMLLCVTVELGAAAYVYVQIVIPLTELNDTLDHCIREGGKDEQELYNTAYRVVFMSKIRVLVDQHASQRTRRNSAEIFDRQTELTALQSQINPHFLYNTLESIRGQALLDDNLEIAKMVEALAAFFRYSISRKGSLVTLRDELANIQNYMMIQRYRFNNRFSLDIFLDEEDEDAYDYLIPRLIIQPVVENAIFHGLEERLEGGKVVIEVIVTEKNLIITISDNGKGMDSDGLEKLNERIKSPNKQLEDKGERQQRNTGIALPNIHKRIQLLFGEEYGVNVYSTVGQGTDVEITIPADYERDTR